MKKLHIGGLHIQTPIIQGGMGVGVSLSGLASAVANQGGVGVIASAGIGMMEPDSHSNFLEASKRALRREIRKAREKTEGVLGVNIMVALTNFADMVKVAIEEGIDVIFSGGGLPLNLPQYPGKNDKTRLVPIVSSARAAKILCRKWQKNYNYIPDAIVVEGPLAGGHLGFKKEHLADEAYSLDNLLEAVLEETGKIEKKYQCSIPVIAGGGIYSGSEICHYLGKGAAGVQMATRFVTTHECDADYSFKKMYLDSKEEDMVIIDSPVGMPGRAIKNEFVAQLMDGKRKPFNCPYHCIISCDYKNSPYCIALSLLNARKGNMKHGFAFAGNNAPRSTTLMSVKEVIDLLKSQFREAVGCADIW